MTGTNERNIDFNRKYEKEKFIIPGIIYIIGVVISYYGSKGTEEITVLGAIGYIVTTIALIILFRNWINEKYRLGLEIGFPLNRIFPNYPLVEDYDELTSNMSEFKKAYADFLYSENRNRDNSSLQDYATQLLWHGIYLQKRRLEKLGVQIDLQTSRRLYSNNASPVRSNSYFDGRYNVDDANEEIYSTRTYIYEGKNIKRVYDKEVAHYTFLSAKSVGEDEVICPNCGSVSSRSNLIDGCDYCGTKFTVEDLTNRVGSFGFNRDFSVVVGKRSAVLKMIYPWFYMIGMSIFFNAGFFLTFLKYSDMNLFLKFLIAILVAFLFSLVGCLATLLAMTVIIPGIVLMSIPILIVTAPFMLFFSNTDLYTYSKERLKQEKIRAEAVRKYDPLFSIQSFFGGVQNKLNAIHFADNFNQINAFSDCDLSKNLEEYKDVVDIDTLRITMDHYDVKDGMQTAMVNVLLIVRELKNGKIKEKKEKIRMYLQKNEDCKTQAVCAPSVLKCKNFGSNLSLIDGKRCEYCGQELNMKEHDWVVTQYTRTK